MKSVNLPLPALGFYAWQKFQASEHSLILCCPDEEYALELYKQLAFFVDSQDHILYFASLDTIAYDRVSPSTEILAKRAACLTALACSPQKRRIIVTNIVNLLYKLPKPEFFSKATIHLKVNDPLEPAKLIEFLVTNSFSRSATAIDNGEFAVRGEILDFVTHDQGYRVNFAWGKIDSIRQFDPDSQLSRGLVDEVMIAPSSELLLNPDTVSNFKSNFLQNFGVNHIDHPLYVSVNKGMKFQAIEHMMPLFYGKNLCSFLDFAPKADILYDNLCKQAVFEYQNSFHDFYKTRLANNANNKEDFYFALAPENLIFNLDDLTSLVPENHFTLLESGENIAFSKFEHIASRAKIKGQTECQQLLELLSANKQKIPIIFCSSNYTKERLKNMLLAYNSELIFTEIEHIKEAKKYNINLTKNIIRGSFANADYIFIPEQEILGAKMYANSGNKSSVRKLHNILTELDNINEGDLVVHKEHGIGRFEKIETIHVGNIAHDCLKIIYANNDILYLPVENIDQFKKFGHDTAELDKLGASHWQQRKARLKNRIQDIAQSLIKLSAARELTEVAPIYFEAKSYEDFCNNFPYSETDDQLAAIEEIKSDLSSGKLMDRLICGDVGFGKTEVAMRGAFMAAMDINTDKPQVVVIAPTTILCRQHYQNFTERFKNMGLKIVQLSRLVKPSQAKKIKAEITDGTANIIIGTHAVLASKIDFYNLKMIIIDEEQHFGVTQKEHLKKLKNGVHVLSLSATPIPRTLQMSMAGIKDLSIIATAPIDRLPVRTHILPFDAVVVRDALMRERFRGGLSFVVVPRIKDIEWISKQLDRAVPELKYCIAHGKMPASEIDHIMSDFCDKKFDILLSTTIIESGIDISIANTMIIHRAQMLGLSQLYQLRGRVGRGKERGYAYLTLGQEKLTKQSMQRLEVLQNIDALGAGFTIASHDMDLRGCGNLVGEEQSGHIKEVGTELYQEMLDEAIAELKSHKSSLYTDQDKATMKGDEILGPQDIDFTPNINLPMSILIPSNYIEDSSLRLVIYRRAGALNSDEEIENFTHEMIDRFGPLPQEFKNLLLMVQLKNEAISLKIISLDSGPNGFVLKFHEKFDVSAMVLGFIAKYPRHCQMKQNNKLVFLKPLNDRNVLSEAKNLLAALKQTEAK
jgi:transcription-repair coupling factor (superfamily II helicase)